MYSTLDVQFLKKIIVLAKVMVTSQWLNVRLWETSYWFFFTILKSIKGITRETTLTKGHLQEIRAEVSTLRHS